MKQTPVDWLSTVCTNYNHNNNQLEILSGRDGFLSLTPISVALGNVRETLVTFTLNYLFLSENVRSTTAI
jgi:hypothetical protein